MLAERAPSGCDASQTIQRAASTVAASSLKVARPDDVADAAVAERGLVVDDEPVTGDVSGARKLARQLGDRAGDGRVGGHQGPPGWWARMLVEVDRVGNRDGTRRRRVGFAA